MYSIHQTNLVLLIPAVSMWVPRSFWLLPSNHNVNLSFQSWQQLWNKTVNKVNGRSHWLCKSLTTLSFNFSISVTLTIWKKVWVTSLSSTCSGSELSFLSRHIEIAPWSFLKIKRIFNRSLKEGSYSFRESLGWVVHWVLVCNKWGLFSAFCHVMLLLN